MTTVKQIKDATNYSADTVSKNKAGQIVLRKGYFYRHGVTGEIFANRVSDLLTAAGIAFTVVDSGDVWKPFRGGATTANSSHLFVTISV